MIGTGINGEITLLDWISILGFIIGVANYEENLTQSDKQDLQSDLSSSVNKLLTEIHAHLEEQDKKINKILEVLNGRSI